MVCPQAAFADSRLRFEPLQLLVDWAILWIPPTSAISDQHLVDFGAIGEKHSSQCAPAFVLAVRVERDVLPKDKCRCGLLGLQPEGLELFRAVDPAEADTFRAFIVENVNHVTLKDTDHLAGELAGHGRRGKPQGEEHCEEKEHRPSC